MAIDYSKECKDFVRETEIHVPHRGAGAWFFQVDLPAKEGEGRHTLVEVRSEEGAPVPTDREVMVGLSDLLGADLNREMEAFGVGPEECDALIGDLRVMGDADFVDLFYEIPDFDMSVDANDDAHMHAQAVLAGELEAEERPFGEHSTADAIGRALTALAAYEQDGGDALRERAMGSFYKAWEMVPEDVHAIGALVEDVPRFTGDAKADAESLCELADTLPVGEGATALAKGYPGEAGTVRETVLARGAEMLHAFDEACHEEALALTGEHDALLLHIDDVSAAIEDLDARGADDDYVDDMRDRLADLESEAEDADRKLEAANTAYSDLLFDLEGVDARFAKDVDGAVKAMQDAEREAEQASLSDPFADGPATAIDFGAPATMDAGVAAETVLREKDASFERTCEDMDQREGFDCSGIPSNAGLVREGMGE